MSTIIAIDGPAASGKGTLARRLAEELGFDYLDTGLLYRAVGMAVLRSGSNPDDAQAATAAAESLAVQDIYAPGLRSDDAAQAASKVAVIPSVRAALLAFQRRFAAQPPRGRGAILDGRDIGTVICPDAPVKLFVTASVEKRAQRRLKELQDRGLPAIESHVLAEMKERDARDSQRSAAPLKAAEDALVIDTTDRDADQAFAVALDYVRSRLP